MPSDNVLNISSAADREVTDNGSVCLPSTSQGPDPPPISANSSNQLTIPATGECRCSVQFLTVTAWDKLTSDNDWL